MAKRPLGLAGSKKNKKQKTTNETSTKPVSKEATPLSESGTPQPPVAGQEEIHIELEQNDDLEDDFTQLKGLWNTYAKSSKDNEILLNGIIHECDRLMRLTELTKPFEFYGIYALALSELAIFQEEDDDKKRFEQIHEFFESSLEFVQDGLRKYAGNKLLELVKSKILFQRIPLEYIAQLAITFNADDTDEKEKSTKDNKNDFLLKYDTPVDLDQILSQAKSLYQSDISNALSKNLSLEILQSFNDLLDIVDNFGCEKIYLDEGLDSDDEEEETKLQMYSQSLDSTHPLYTLTQKSSDNYAWLLKKLEVLHEKVSSSNETKDTKFDKKILKTAGGIYMRMAFPHIDAYTELAFDDDDEKPRRKQKAICLGGRNYADDEPEDWANYSECLIELGNLHEIDSKEQQQLYKEAEELLNKANKATNGKYQDILNNLLTDN
ncbi:hypothetical protein ACO0QE_004732 [Hanseniaspora vineae]